MGEAKKERKTFSPKRKRKLPKALGGGTDAPGIIPQKKKGDCIKEKTRGGGKQTGFYLQKGARDARPIAHHLAFSRAGLKISKTQIETKIPKVSERLHVAPFLKEKHAKTPNAEKG